MGQQAPNEGQVSPDGEYIWDGSRWNPIRAGTWEATETTRRMQLLAGGYLVAAGLLTVILAFFEVSYVRHQTEQILAQSQRNQGLTPDQLKQIVDFSVNLGIAIAVTIGLVFVAFGIMTLLRRWSWLFYADLVIFGLGGLGVFTGVFGLARGTAGPPGFAIPSLVLAAVELCLFVWMLITRVRGSVWGARRIAKS